MSEPRVLLSFDASALASSEGIADWASECYRHWRQGRRVVAAVDGSPFEVLRFTRALKRAGMEARPVVGSRLASSGVSVMGLDGRTGSPFEHRRNLEHWAKIFDATCLSSVRIPRAVEPTQVVLLGAGTVGGGVLRRLLTMPKEFEVVAVVTRHPDNHPELAHAGIRHTSRWEDALEAKADIVVEAMGGLQPAEPAIRRALETGRNVVTANKAVIACRPDLATQTRFSAAVGGATPMVETVQRLTATKGIRSIKGVFNGTTNFLLNETASGRSLSDALKEAVAKGLAEADPSGDVLGCDAAYKLRILAREAWGVELDWQPELSLQDFEKAAEPGKRLRQIGEATPEGIRITIEEVGPTDALADLPGAMNALIVEDGEGNRHTIRGTGAGRGPTTEAVLADLADHRLAWAAPIRFGETSLPTEGGGRLRCRPPIVSLLARYGAKRVT